MNHCDRSLTIRIVAIWGSVRPSSYTSKALALVVDELREREVVEVVEIDLAKIALPLPGQSGHDKTIRYFVKTVKGASGVVIATPEYHGSFSSAIKLAIENIGFPNALASKPVALLGMAQGRIGAVKALWSICAASVTCWRYRASQSCLSRAGAGDLRRKGKLPRHRDREAHSRRRHGVVGLHQKAICPRKALATMARTGGSADLTGEHMSL